VASVVVGLDGSTGSLAALRWAAGAADALGEELLAVSVVSGGTDSSAVETEMRRAVPREAGAFAGPFRTEVIEGTAGPALAGVAAGLADCLVVVGRGHGGWFPALHLGSASHHLVHRINRAICVVPPGSGRFDPNHVVIGLDGTDGSRAAAEWLRLLARATGSKVTAVYAWEHSATRMSNVARGPDTQEEADEACAGWATALGADGVLAGTRAVRGEPSEVLAAAAAEAHAGLLVLGKRAERRPGEIRLGGVPLRLLQRGALPILLVPPPT